MADKETKFSDEELQELRDLQTNYQQRVFDFGNLKVEKMLMKYMIHYILLKNGRQDYIIKIQKQ